MIDSLSRRMTEPDYSGSRPKFADILAVCAGGATMFFGGALAAGMAVAMFLEFLEGDFYGTCVTGMIVVFGAQLMKAGFHRMARHRPVDRDPDPLDKLWKSEARVFPYLPYSHLEVRGR